jgi:hypothetical protein
MTKNRYFAVDSNVQIDHENDAWGKTGGKLAFENFVHL